MGFGEALRSVIVEHYATFSGRARRAEYWWFALFSLLVSIALGIVGESSDTLGDLLQIVIGLGLLIPSLAVQVRRLHDIDRTGWWLLIGLVPLIGWIVLLIFYVQRGTEGDNRFGPDPIAEPAGGRPA